MDLDSRIQRVRTELERVQRDRDDARVVYETETQGRLLAMEIYRTKITKLFRRGCDTSRYNRAIQDVYSYNNSSCSSSGSNTFIPQQYLQMQAMVSQMLHKNDMYTHQIEIIEVHSMKLVNYMMCEASVIEKEQSELENDLMMQQGNYMNETFEMENRHHIQMRELKATIRRMQHLVVGTEEMELRKLDERSVDTVDTFNDSGSVGNMQNDSPINGLLNSFSKLLAIY